MNTKGIFLRLVLLSLVLTVASSQAQAPNLLNYQGKLTEGGNPVNGNRSMTFAIYSTPTGGTPLWTETRNVTVTNGVFNELLGSVAPFPGGLFTSAGERYLGIKVGTDPEMTPRFRLASVAFALRASEADGVADGAINTVDFANNAVTSAKIADGAINSAKVQDNGLTDVDINSAAAIAISKIFGDVGIEFANLGSSSDIPTAVRNLGSVSINCPSSGFVLLFLSGHAIFFGDQTIVDVGFSTNASSFNLHSTRVGRHDGGGTLRYVNSFSDIVVTNVTAGVRTFFANAQKEPVFSANTTNLGELYLVAVFIPKRY